MTVETLGLVVLLVVSLDLWAAVSIVGSARPRGRKALWILVVLLLPVLGFLAWAACGPRTARRDH